MKKKVIIVIIALIIIVCFCWNGKTEFIKSKANGGLYLIKNPPENNSLLKKEIILFLTKNYSKTKKQFTQIDFYKYSWKTKYFINNKEDYSGGFSGEEIGFYPEDYLATFIISKCENDTTKLVGELRLHTNFYQSDTIIYKCN